MAGREPSRLPNQNIDLSEKVDILCTVYLWFTMHVGFGWFYRPLLVYKAKQSQAASPSKGLSTKLGGIDRLKRMAWIFERFFWFNYLVLFGSFSDSLIFNLSHLSYHLSLLLQRPFLIISCFNIIQFLHPPPTHLNSRVNPTIADIKRSSNRKVHAVNKHDALDLGILGPACHLWRQHFHRQHPY